MISQEQSDLLERQQAQSLKNIYGLGLSASKMRDRAGLRTLSERRIDCMKNFANKAQQSDRFSHWFVQRPDLGRGRRTTADFRRFEEPIARTERHWNSPKNAMRRCLNEQWN